MSSTGLFPQTPRCVHHMLVRLAILNGGGQTVAHAVENIGKGLHLVYIISLRNGQLAEHMGIGVDVAGADFNLVHAGAWASRLYTMAPSLP